MEQYRIRIKVTECWQRLKMMMITETVMVIRDTVEAVLGVNDVMMVYIYIQH